MKINKAMNTETSVCPHDVEWIGSFYNQALKAATVSNLDEVTECMEWCASIQSEVIVLLKSLSGDEAIHRDLAADDKSGLDFSEAEYNRLICFISGAGVAVSEISNRLRAAKHTMQYEQYHAKKS